MKNNKGLTLIEVVLTITIIGIIAISILSIFNTGLVNIVRAGIRTENVLNIQKDIDDAIKNKSGTVGEVIVSIPGVTDKDGLDKPVVVPGKLIVIPSDDNSIQITTFVPN